MLNDKKIKRVILHAGLPKTATTSIQNACFAQKQALLDHHGILYPGQEPNHTNALCTAFLTDPRTHISNMMAGQNDLDSLLEKAADIRAALVHEIHATAPETVLFSAEGMSNLAAPELEKFRDWALSFAEELSVFYILRNPISYTTSVIQQHLKGGDVLEHMFKKLPLPNIKGRLTGSIRAFGRENVAAYVFEELVSNEGGVVAGFLDIVGLRDGTTRDAIVSQQNFDNQSLSHEAALILSSLNRQRPAFVNGRLGPYRAMNELPTISAIRGDKFRLPPDVAARVLDESRPDIDWVRETFGINAYDDLQPPPPPKDREMLPEATIDSIAVTMSNLLNDRQVNALVNRARVLHRDGRMDEVRPLAENVLRIRPNRPLPEFMAKAMETPR
ncbi:MAG: hypothetical protein KDA50_06715 [Rhodobacteraceae bacterium]|nr:hypothetical protein [Paracoccaceae bacterium]